MRQAYAGIRRGVLAGVLVALAAGSADAAPAVRQVLILQSSERGTLVFDLFTADFRAALEELFPEPVTVTQFAITPSGFAEAPERSIVDYLRSAFLNQSKPDLIVTVGGPAATFARKYRQELFSQVPVLFGLTDVRFLRDTPLADNETGVATAGDFTRLVDDILHILPGTTTVFMVTGAGPLARLWRGELEHDFERYRSRLTFIWSDDLAYRETLERVASLPPHSAILYITSGSDAERGWHSTERVLADLSTQGNAPLFGVHSRWLGLGIVGGTLMFTEGLGRTAAEAAARILNGESPARVRIPPVEQGPAAFDARQLRRWNIPEARLPAGSIVRFRGPSLWRDYRREVLTTLGVVAIQSILIVGLLYQRRARRRAEVESRRNLTLAADANRQATMSALTGSIAHELSQPLNSILHNAQAAEKLVASNRATPEMLREILSDIRTADGRATQIIDRHRAMLRNRQLDQKPLDIHTVVRESLALIDQDMRARRVQMDMDLPPHPCMIVGDSVLLQQVLVNLLINAMDAMAETPPGRRRLRVQTDVRPDSVAVSVRDAGTGLPASIDGRLFEPFVSTKADGIGIGLTIAHSIVEAHRGRMEAHNNADGGATFTFTLPCGEASAFV